MTRILVVGLWLALAASALAGTLTITSPTEGAFLGTTNSVKFAISGATVEVTVRAVLTGPGGTVYDNTEKFTPDSNGKITGTMTLNINPSTPEGDYTLTVTATEPNNTYTPQTVNVKVDVAAPKFLEFSPVNGGFVRSIVKIRATLRETNLKDWRVKVNGQDIPNNTGSTNSVAVDWNTDGIEKDGAQSITITARDEANNSTTQTINVTLDRVAPVVTIVFPAANSKIVPNTTISVIVDVTDASTSSVDPTGIDVVARRMDGTFIARIVKISAKGQGGNAIRWTGRLKPRAGLPSQFKIVATAIDRAGNVATAQEVTVNVGGGRSWGGGNRGRRW